MRHPTPLRPPRSPSRAGPNDTTGRDNVCEAVEQSSHHPVGGDEPELDRPRAASPAAALGGVGIPDPRRRPVISAQEAFELLNIDRTTGYRTIRDGTFPLPIIRVGRQLRIPTVALLRLLEPDPAEPPAVTALS